MLESVQYEYIPEIEKKYMCQVKKILYYYLLVIYKSVIKLCKFYFQNKFYGDKFENALSIMLFLLFESILHRTLRDELSFEVFF